MTADENLLTAIAVVQAHEAPDHEALSALMTNARPTDIVSGLIDLVRLIARVSAPDTGRSSAELLSDLWALYAPEGLTPEQITATTS